jgi:hypothetical protein
MVSREDCSERVSRKGAQDVARKEVVVDHGTSKHKIRSFSRKRYWKEYKLKSDKKNKPVVLNQDDSSKASSHHKSLSSESNSVGKCSSGIEMSYKDFVEDERQAKAFEREIVAQTATDVSMILVESLVEVVGVSGIFDDQVEAAMSGKEINSVLETKVYPTRDPENGVSAEPTDASNPTNNVENIENVASKILDRQVTSADSNTTFSEEEQNAFGVDRRDPLQEEFGIHEHDSKENNLFPDAKAVCDKLELMKKLTCDFVDFLFDIIDIESSTCFGKKAASAEVNNGNSDKKGNFFSGNLDENLSLASGSLGENGWHAKNDNASFLNENCNDSFIRNHDSSNFGGKSIINDNTSLNENVTATYGVHLLQDMPDIQRHSCDPAEPDAVASSKRRIKEIKNESEEQSSETGLKKLFDETKIALKMMIVEKDVNEEIQTGATKLEKLRAFERFNAVAEPLKGQQRKANSTPAFLESGMIWLLESNVVLPKDDGASFQSSLDYSYLDWESGASPMEEGSMIVDNFPDDEVSSCNENCPLFVEGLKNEIVWSDASKSGAGLQEAHRKVVPLNITVAKRRARP